MHPNSSSAYKELGILSYTNKDFDQALHYFTKQAEVAQRDTILMQDQRDATELSARYDIARVHALRKDIPKTIEVLDQLILEEKKARVALWFFDDFHQTSGIFSEILKDKNFLDTANTYITTFSE